jgi:poly(A) polymerase
MVSPIIVPRAEHTLSRRDIDPDALKVLYRLHGAGHVAYLVGGSVRDLLLGRRPKDFDIGTDAHPYEVKRLFRNCWIIGRRFRLAHVKFGTKTIEVATFRTHLVPGTESEPPVPHEAPPHGEAVGPPAAARGHDPLIHRDNTFGTPEEDAFRRDFTVNALFYDIGSFAVIDYVGGLQDLRDGVIRSIGDPEVRFREDPVRMLRAVVLQARLGFRLDPPVLGAITQQGAEIARSAPARLLDEVYKILRSGAAAAAFRELATVGLLGHIAPPIATPLPPALVRSLEALDAYRARHDAPPDTLTNPVLLGTVLAPLGLVARSARREAEPAAAEQLASRSPLGALPVARRDVERLSYALSLVHRLQEADGAPRTRANLLRRHAFPDALTWLDIRGDAPDAVAFWRKQLAEAVTAAAGPAAPAGPDTAPVEDLPRRRRRRRRGRRRPA